MIAILLGLVVCLTASLHGNGEEFNPLGRGMNLHNYNIMGSLEESGAQVLIPQMLRSCSWYAQQPMSSQAFSYYKNTKAFYSSTTTTAGLDSSLQSDYALSFTLDSVSKGISASTRTVSGNSLLIMASNNQTLLNKDCINKKEYIDPDLLRGFENLPYAVNNPWVSSSWELYDAFLKKHGSHVVTSITYGSSINQMSFADTSDSYSERDFQVKSCLSLAGPTEVGELGISTCYGIDESEISQVTTMTMSDELVVRGGTVETRNELMKHRTPELIEQFMNEANVTYAPIQYSFTPIWDILQSIYAGQEHHSFLRAINLEYYYLGYLNYGCDYQSSGGQVFQMFNFTDGTSSNSPQYECSLAPQGCHSHDDCHYKPIWCSCRGQSCVRYKQVPLDTGDEKTVAYANVNEDWGWHGCNWKPGLAGSKCICKDPSNTRKVVWTRDKKDAMYQAHHNSIANRKAMMEAKTEGKMKEEL